MKSFTDISTEAHNLSTKIAEEFSFLGEDNLTYIFSCKCPLCENGDLHIDYRDSNIITCSNYFCNYRKSI